jgi:hypothetical protein
MLTRNKKSRKSAQQCYSKITNACLLSLMLRKHNSKAMLSNKSKCIYKCMYCIYYQSNKAVTYINVCKVYYSYVLAKLSLSYPVNKKEVKVCIYKMQSTEAQSIYVLMRQVKTSVTVLSSCLQLRK